MSKHPCLHVICWDKMNTACRRSERDANSETQDRPEPRLCRDIHDPIPVQVKNTNVVVL